LKTTIIQKEALDPTRWLDSHGDYLYRYALARVRDAAVAEDLVQETLLAAIGSTHAGRSSERTWLVGIMKHKVVDYFRRVARMTQFQLTIDDEESESFETSGPWRGHWREDQAPVSWPFDAAGILESREFWETFDRCLSQLPQQIAIAFTLREIDGLSANEICEILQITPNNLFVILHRGRAKLRHLLEAEWFRKHTPSAHRDQKSSDQRTAETTSQTHLTYQAAAA
jgi:RNA polymerase sigma-70 factor (TIGR02943 family)